MIHEQPGWHVVAEATDGKDAVAKADEFKPDVAILDVNMPSLNGLDATTQIAKLSPRTKVLILSIHESDPLIHKFLGAGARGYILKADAGRELIAAVKALLANKTFFTPTVAQKVRNIHLDEARKANQNAFSPITGRQREVLQLLVEGKSTKEVANILGIAFKTAETHRMNLMRRLDCHSVAELVRYAIRNHIVEA